MQKESLVTQYMQYCGTKMGTAPWDICSIFAADPVHGKGLWYARRKMKKEEKLQKTWNHSHHLKLRPHTWKGVTHIQLGCTAGAALSPFQLNHFAHLVYKVLVREELIIYLKKLEITWYYKPSIVAASHHCCYLVPSWYSFFHFPDPLGNTCSTKVPKSLLKQPCLLQFCVKRSRKCVGSEIGSTFVTQIYHFSRHTSCTKYSYCLLWKYKSTDRKSVV